MSGVLALYLLCSTAYSQPDTAGGQQSTDNYPKPVSEYTEQTGPGQMTFLSYPKYYKNTEGNLSEVNCTLVPSKDKEWDYEVTTGIWTLKVRKDGTFQAQHEGDIFTYRLNSLGVGRGSKYQPFKGEPNFAKYQVMGDTIRWVEVFPMVDLSVRYINDILKVDVIVKKDRVKELSTLVKTGELNGEDYLTARFDIPQVLVLSQPKLGEEKADMYAERLEIGAMPLQFEKNSKIVHQLRPVEIQLQDDKGNFIQPAVDEKGNDPLRRIQTAQVWQLKQSGSGIAEMSVKLSDISQYQDVNVVIDPITSFVLDAVVRDTWINQIYPFVSYGTSSTLYMARGGSCFKRILFGFDVSSLPNDINITNASMTLTYSERSSSSLQFHTHKVTSDWDEYYADWIEKNYNQNWTSSGGDFEENYFQGKIATFETSGQYIYVDVTSPLKSHLINNVADMFTKGVAVDLINDGTVVVFSHASLSLTERPKLYVNYDYTQFGGGAGNGWDNDTTVSRRMSDAASDNLPIVRYFGGGTDGKDQNVLYMNQAKNKGRKVIFVLEPRGFVNADNGYRNSPTGFADYIVYRLNYISANCGGNSIFGNTIFALQTCNEEEAKWSVSDATADCFYAGTAYAPYYLAAVNRLRSDPKFKDIKLIGASIENHKSLDYSYNIPASDGYKIPGVNFDVGKAARAFLYGYFYQVINDATGGLDKMPDYIDIHGYTGKLSPEWYGDGGGNKEWIDRLKTLETISNNSFWKFPGNFLELEYGYCPDPYIRNMQPIKDDNSYLFACVNADQKKQAVYFMRRVLLDVAMRSNSGKSWGITSYWEQSMNDWKPANNFTRDTDINFDFSTNTGWFEDFQQNTWRSIRKVAQHIFSKSTTNGNYPGLQNETRIWSSVPITKVYKNGLGEDNSYVIRIGWINAAGQKWGAIWRYRYLPDDGTYYTPTNVGSETFVVNNESPVTASVFKFSFTSPYGYANTQWPSNPTSITGNLNGNNSQYTIPSLDENPTFIKFGN